MGKADPPASSIVQGRNLLLQERKPDVRKRLLGVPLRRVFAEILFVIAIVLATAWLAASGQPAAAPSAPAPSSASADR